MYEDGSVKLFAKKYISKAGNPYFWGRFGGYEVRIFNGKPHEGVQSLDVYVKPVEEEPRNTPPPQAEVSDDEIPF